MASIYLSKAIRYAADSGARVINISASTTVHSPQLTAAVKYALDRGSLVFAAVGNNGDKGNTIEYPAATPGVVGVAAVGKNLRRSAWSEYGPQVDVSAPGDDMVHACGGRTGLCRTSGTSDATAIASASAALVWSKHPGWTNNQVLRVMLHTIGRPTDGARRNDSIGYGIVRPRIALQNPGDPGPADVYPLPDRPASASAPPSPGADPNGQTVRAKGDPATTEASTEEKGGTTLWAALGIGAPVLLGAAGVVVATRRRRRSAA